MADTLTNVLQLTKPEIGGSQDTWGTKFNANLDALDAVFAANGGGTSVGLNVGAGKTLTMAGALSASGTSTFTGPVNLNGAVSFGAGSTVTSATGAPPWVPASDLVSTPAVNKGIKADANGVWQFGLGLAARGVWDASGQGTFGVNAQGNFLPRPTDAVEVNRMALASGADHGGLQYNAFWKTGGSGPSHYRSHLGRAWGMMFNDNYCSFGASATLEAADTEVVWRWTFAINHEGATYSYVGYGVSDRREKGELQPITDALAKVDALAGYTFTMERTGAERHAGVIAQDVQLVLPEAVRDMEGRLVVNHNGVTALLIEAVKELSARLTAAGL